MASSSPARVLAVLHEVVSAVAGALEGLDDWGLAGTREGQYRSDLIADRAALEVIDRAGLGADIFIWEPGMECACHMSDEGGMVTRSSRTRRPS